MKQKLYHIRSDKSNMYNFIRENILHTKKVYHQNIQKIHKSPWYVDKITGKYFIEEAENLIQLRNTKNTHFYNLKNRVKYFHIIKQETLEEDINKMI